MKRVRCPSCKQWTNYEGNPHRPFCSKNCRNRDLGNWATERYRIPTQVSGEVPAKASSLSEEKKD